MKQKRLMAKTKDLRKIDEKCTFKPKISQNSTKLATQKNPSRQAGDPN